MAQALPPRPSLEHLKNQAKQLLRAALSSDSLALQRLQAVGIDTSRRLRLADAQYAIANEYGYVRWSDLKQAVDDIIFSQQAQHEQIEALIQHALNDRLVRADRLQQRYPELGQANIFVAAAVGNRDAVEQFIRQRPQAVNEPGGPLNGPPLVYACASHYAKSDSSREQEMRAIVGYLLAHGADPNSSWHNAQYNCQLSALYGACGINDNASIAELLLKAGATPNDNESLYHSVEHHSAACTELLLRYDAKISGTNAVHHALACDNIRALSLFLDHGVDINERIHAQQSMTLLQWAIECGQSREVLEMLIARGADLRATSRDGVSAFRRAIHHGHRAAVELLTEHGVAESLSQHEELIAACMAGETPRAKQILDSKLPLGGDLLTSGHGLLTAAAWRGQLAAVRTMLEIGFDIASTDQRRATALHAAAWQGHADVVELLLEHDPPLDGHDSEFDCTPLEWALHGSKHCHRTWPANAPRDRDSSYVAITRALVRAGSPPPIARITEMTEGGVREVLADAELVSELDD
ncbi:MAG: ankyrin repeat domain-containing protein [Planctomycetales bacterium]|nr:ankyrin repeat domain-containing protein [Planctomycetales bacterium]MCA9168736.1 ankyrin repeat domain-containing protein [Planctomycetales bacterium]